MVKRLGSHEVRPQIIQQGKRVRTRQLNNPQGEIVKSSTTSWDRALPSSTKIKLATYRLEVT